MKKLLTILILSSLYAPLHCMEEGIKESLSSSSSTAPSSTIAQMIKIQTSDGEIFTVNKDIIAESITIKNLLEDLGDTKEALPLPEITASDFKTILFYLEHIHALQNKTENEEKQTLIIDLKNKSIDELTTITKNANYLEASILLECCIDALAQILSPVLSIEKELSKLNLPLELKRLLIKKLVAKKNLIDTAPIAQCKGHTGPVRSVCTIKTKDGWRIISGSDDKTIRIWNMDGNQLKILTGHTGPVRSVCAIKTKDGWRIISGSHDRTIRIWDIDGNQLKILIGHKNLNLDIASVCAVETENGLRIISLSHDFFDPKSNNNTVRIWDINDNKIAWCHGCIKSICIAKTENGSRIISGSRDDSTLGIWDMNGNKLSQCHGHTGPATSVCAIKTKNGRLIISGSSFDKTIRIWNMNGNQISQCNDNTDHITSLSTVKINHELHIISSFYDSIQIWDMNGNKLSQCRSHGLITSIYAIPTNNGLRIVSGCLDNIIHIWNTLDIFDKIKNITESQATALCQKIDSIKDNAALYKEIKQILNNESEQKIEEHSSLSSSNSSSSSTINSSSSASFFNPTNITTPGVLSATVENLMQKRNKK